MLLLAGISPEAYFIYVYEYLAVCGFIDVFHVTAVPLEARRGHWIPLELELPGN